VIKNVHARQWMLAILLSLVAEETWSSSQSPTYVMGLPILVEMLMAILLLLVILPNYTTMALLETLYDSITNIYNIYKIENIKYKVL
jgi:hypothetical protein